MATVGRTYNQLHVPRKYAPENAASACTGRGAIRGKPIATSRTSTTAFRR